MGQILTTMRRLGVDRGLLEGRKIWLVLGTVAWTIKALRWVANRDETAVFSGSISAGDRLLITATDPKLSRGGRRRRGRGHH